MAKNTEQRKIEIIADGKKANASIKEMRAAVSLLNNQLDKLPQGTKEFVAKSKEFKEVKKRLSEVTQEAKTIKPALDDSGKGMGLLTKGTELLKLGFQAAVTALLPLFAFQKLIELGKHLLNIESSVSKLKSSVEKLTGAQGNELDKLSIQVTALANTFDKDYNEVLKAGNVLAQQMGISHEEAFTLIEKGLLAGTDLNDDFLEQISEYAPQFKQAGIEAEDFVVQLIRAEKEGIFSDKGADVIKEFGLRIREQTKATKAALEGAFGEEFTQGLFAGINNGSITTVEALKRVSTQMNNTEVSASALQTVVADVFGGPGEDAGIEYLKSLKGIGGEIDDLIDISDAYTRRQVEQLALEKEVAAAQQELGDALAGSNSLWNTITGTLQVFAYKALTATINGFEYLVELFHNSDAAIVGFKTAFIAALNGIKDFVFNHFGAVGDLLIGIVTFDIDKIKGAYVKAFQNFKSYGADIAKSFQEGYESSLTPEQLAERAAKELEKQRAIDAERQKQHQETTISQLKEHNEKIAKEKERLRQLELAADRQMQDLKVAVMDEGLEKELAQLALNYERKLEAVTGNEQQIEEQKRLLNELWKQEREELEAEYDQQQFEAQLLKMDEEEAAKKAVLQNQFLNRLATEAEYQQALLDLQRSTLQAKLTLLEQAGKGETEQANKVRDAILGIDKEKADKKIEHEKKVAEEKEKIENLSYEASRDFLDLGIQLMDKEQKEKGKHANAFKAFTMAKIAVDSQQEIQAIWLAAESSPIAKLLGPVAGTILAVAQTALAVNRARKAIQAVASQGFAGGGFTSALSVNNSGKMVDSTGHAVAGVVHEKEWVSPRWMVESPKYASTIAWLESERTRRFAEGGFSSPPPGVSAQGGQPEFSEMMAILQRLNANFSAYAGKVDHWANTLKVNNDPRDIQEGIRVVNEVDQDSRIS